MGRVIITRSQLGRVTRWFLTHHHHSPPPSSSTTITSFIKQWSTTTKTSSSSSSSSEKQQKTLPENIVRLTCSSTDKSGFCVVYLVGTCHISKKSSLEVKTLINTLKPEVVFLELCKERLSLLTIKDIKEPTVEEIIAMMMTKKTNILGMLISLIYRLIAAERKIIPGSEFRVAYEEAMKYGGKVVLGDRPAQITLTRAWRRMPLSELKRVFSLSSSIEDLLPCIVDCSSLTDILMKMHKASDDMSMDAINRFTQEMSKISPTLMETFIHERDKFMSFGILHEAKRSRSVVAVVGKAHLEGIKKHWQKHISIDDLKDLLSVPPPWEPTMSAKVLTSVGVFMVGVAMIWRCL